MKLYQNRDFGQLFSDSLNYCINNAATLFKPLLMYVAPVMAIGGIISGLYAGDMMSELVNGLQNIADGGSPDAFMQNLVASQADIPWWTTPIALLVTFVGSALHAGVLYQHMRRYSKDPESVKDEEGLRAAAFDILGLMVVGILVTFIAMILLGFAYGIMVGISAIIHWSIAMLVGLGGLFALLYFSIPLFLPLVVLNNEEVGVIQSISRSYQIVRSNWWLALGVLVIMYILVALANTFVSLPLTFLMAQGTVAMVISQVISAAVSIILTTPLWVAAGMIYYSYVEAPDGDGYIDQTIDQIGE